MLKTQRDPIKPFLTVEDLSAWLGKAPATIKVDLHRRPETLPPAIKIPGTRVWLFRTEAVEEWLTSFERTKRPALPEATKRGRGRPRKST